jgi:hypothetical protein
MLSPRSDTRDARNNALISLRPLGIFAAEKERATKPQQLKEF